MGMLLTDKVHMTITVGLTDNGDAFHKSEVKLMMNFQLIRIPVHAVEENRSWISDGFVSCCYPGFDG